MRAEQRHFLHELGISGKDVESEIYRIAEESRWPKSKRRDKLATYRAIRRDIRDEIDRATRFVNADHPLEQYNEWLAGLGLSQEKSLFAAKRALNRVHIGIYDLLDGLYENRQRNLWELRRHLEETRTFYDLQAAKGDLVKVFLRQIYE